MAYGRAEVLSISDGVVLYRITVQQVNKLNSELVEASLITEYFSRK